MADTELTPQNVVVSANSNDKLHCVSDENGDQTEAVRMPKTYMRPRKELVVRGGTNYEWNRVLGT